MVSRAGISKKTWKTKKGIKSCYEITFYDENGKQRHRGGFKTKLEAQLALKEIVEDTSIDIRFGKLAKKYISTHCQIHCKLSTIDLYNGYLDRYLYKFDNRIARELKKRDLELLVLDLQNKGLCNKAINNVIALAISVLNYGVEIEYLKQNPIQKFDKLPQVKQPPKYLNDIQQEVFLNEAENCPITYYAFFYTALKTGMRRGELLALEWTDIDFKGAKIWINKQIYRGKTTTTKTGKERYVDMPSTLIQVLKKLHKETTLSKYVFHYNGKPLHPWNMENTYFKPLLDRCNKILDSDNQIRDFRFHDLRHSFATYLLSKGIPVKYVQERLGHSSARMTLDVYANFLPSVKYEALELLDRMNKSESKIKIAK